MAITTQTNACQCSERHRAGLEEPPPLYSSPQAGGSLIPSSPPPFKSKPTNFLFLSTASTPIRDEFVIDPSICLPPYLLPPLGENGERKNLSLTSRDCSVDADIWLIPSAAHSSGQKPQRTTITLASDCQSIFARLRTLEGASPCLLTCNAPHGMVRLVLPRSFHGLLSLSTRPGKITLSNGLTQNATQLSQITSVQWYFVGEIEALGQDTWEGDQVEIEAPEGCIQLSYADEETEGNRVIGLISRISQAEAGKPIFGFRNLISLSLGFLFAFFASAFL